MSWLERLKTYWPTALSLCALGSVFWLVGVVPVPLYEKDETLGLQVSLVPKAEDVFLADSETRVATSTVATTEPTLAYIEVIESCGAHFEGACLNVRSGPGVEFPAVAQLRQGVVLRVGETVVNEEGTWYRVIFDEWLRYPERVAGAWYVAAPYVRPFTGGGIETETSSSSPSQVIVVDRSEQLLTAYENKKLIFSFPISTGLELTPTPRGTFTVYKKTPTRYMQGPLPYLATQQYYDLPGVPWNLYFTEGGAVVHGAYWHEQFGTPYSHGCVNLSPQHAKELYDWAHVGATVVVQD